MYDILDPILRSPRLKEYLNEITSYVRKEEEKRLKFYIDITEQVKAEFINGEVVIHSPVIRKHNQIGTRLLKLLDTFVSVNSLGFVGYEKILIRLSRNDFEPDICFFRKEVADTFSDKTMFFPAPDFAVEILSKSTEKNDRGVKFFDYAFHGVKEYWIIDIDDDMVEQYLLNDGKEYQLHIKMHEGMIYSKIIPGFNIPVLALFDEATNNDTLKKFL